ncbi:energy transducer TonB [Rhodanobacter sp. DHG33]|uniref:energy transducer TonB n=1 Tax=Rhodanobacter sp. DHG33 TaxID=2775921 RepID=UPI0017818410|nr:energy transducer TonB [Rhodanobacter sp. DHG33]MBD8898951.1 energy transducer TonB [Rhodanobacter sp. DHG33]
MSSASLAVAVRPHPDPVRIAALSAAIALNLTALLILTRPLAPQAMDLIHRVTTVPEITFIKPLPPVKPPPPIDLKPLPRAPVVVPVHVQPQPTVTPPIVTPSTEGTQPMPQAVPPSATPSDANTAEPVEATLAYRSSPLQFPTLALRQHMQGTVLLRVLVDESGVPLQVEIEHGSGYTVLDRSAREQVLAHWRFQPAMVNGHAVRAWAKVPVNFVLNNL